MKIETKGTYLGEEIGKSAKESISLTLDKRIPLVRKAIFEIKHLVEDCRSSIVGGINSGLLLWNSCIIPFLYGNSSTWMDISANDINRLVKIENLFLNMLLNVYKCPAALMYWDLKVTVAPVRILRNKLLLYHHISSLPKTASMLSVNRLWTHRNK